MGFWENKSELLTETESVDLVSYYQISYFSLTKSGSFDWVDGYTVHLIGSIVASIILMVGSSIVKTLRPGSLSFINVEMGPNLDGSGLDLCNSTMIQICVWWIERLRLSHRPMSFPFEWKTLMSIHYTPPILDLLLKNMDKKLFQRGIIFRSERARSPLKKDKKRKSYII